MKRRQIVAIICLSLLGLSLILKQFYGDIVWIITIIILATVMLIQSGNDSNWVIEKSIAKLFRKRDKW